MIVKLLTEHHLEFLSLTGGCRGSSKSTLVKMSNCWKSHAAAHIPLYLNCNVQESSTKLLFISLAVTSTSSILCNIDELANTSI